MVKGMSAGFLQICQQWRACQIMPGERQHPRGGCVTVTDVARILC